VATYNFKVAGNSVQNTTSNTYTTTSLTNGQTVAVDITVSGGACLTTNAASSNSISNIVVTNQTWYRDLDGDGFGDFNTPTSNCVQPVGYVSNSTDCDDTRGFVYPGAPDICYNNIKENCNDSSVHGGCTVVYTSLAPYFTAVPYYNMSAINTTVLATIPSVSGGTITGYIFEATNETTGVTAPPVYRADNKFNLNMTSINAYNTIFSIRVKVIVNSEEQEYGPVKRVKTPALTAAGGLLPAQCEQVLPTIKTSIYTTQITLAAQYEFTLTSSTFTNPLHPVQVITTSVPYFRLSQMSNYTPAYSAVYSVTVRVKTIVNGQDSWSNPSGVCNIFTPSVPNTQVVASQCGQMLSTMNATISGVGVPFAPSYSFRVANVNDLPTTEDVQVGAQPLFRLNMLQTIPLDYEQTYRVWVKAEGGDYSSYCDIMTPMTPVSNLIGDCEAGFAPGTLATSLSCTTYPGATYYRFILQGFNGTNEIYTQYVDRAVPNVSLSMFPSIPTGGDNFFFISVGLRFVGGEIVYPKESCPIAIPSTRMVALPFSVTASPNPYAGHFTLSVTSSSQEKVALKVYDMVGRLVEEREVKVSDLESTTIGERYPSGVYNVVVTQGEEVQTVRVVKR
jgi:hypothetical protein